MTGAATSSRPGDEPGDELGGLLEAIERCRCQHAPFIVGIAGAVAVGKTTIARAVADATGAVVVSTDGFLLSNSVLCEQGALYRKGFPDTYDVGAMVEFLDALRGGQPVVEAPLYSHDLYDIDPVNTLRIERAGTVIFEGVNALAPLLAERLHCRVYVDAADEHVEAWFVERFLGLCDAAADDPGSFYRQFTGLDVGARIDMASMVWAQVNRPNLEQHIAPTMANADVIVHKDASHRCSVTFHDDEPPAVLGDDGRIAGVVVATMSAEPVEPGQPTEGTESPEGGESTGVADPTELAGRIAVVTGAGSGFGAAMCRRFAEAGMAIATLDIDEDRARAVATTLASEHGVATMAIRVDVGDLGSLADAAAAVETGLGGCDLLCANVGVQQFGAIDRLTDDDWAWVINVNVLGTVRTVASFLPLLRRRSGWRRIVLTASSGVLVPSERLGAYQTSKFAVLGYGETLRQELAHEGIGVTVVFPAGMMTRHLESSALARPADTGAWVLLPDDIEVLLASSGMGPEQVATPEHAVRNLVADLLADARYVITHGSYRNEYHQRLAALESAFDRMERS